jgi:mono/diheme cytochrome c family protein
MRKRHFWPIVVVVIVVLATLSLAACGTSTSSTTAGPTTSAAGPTTTAGGAADAAALYTQNCAGCHQFFPNGTADNVKAIIESGKQSMPGFKDQLTADQITALANWIANGGK